MDYQNDTIRRQDRLLDEARAQELLRTTDYGVLSMTDEQGLPYGIPVNYVYDGDHTIFIHCAPEGKKLRALSAHPEVSFCLVGHVNLLPDKFTTEYESVVLSGRARFDLSPDERRQALHLLVDRLSPEFKALGYQYTEKSFHRVQVIRVDFDRYTGKQKKMHRQPVTGR